MPGVLVRQFVVVVPDEIDFARQGLQQPGMLVPDAAAQGADNGVLRRFRKAVIRYSHGLEASLRPYPRHE